MFDWIVCVHTIYQLELRRITYLASPLLTIVNQIIPCTRMYLPELKSFFFFFFFFFRQPWCYCLWFIGKARKYNAMYRQGCFFFLQKTTKNNKERYTYHKATPHPHTPTPTHIHKKLQMQQKHWKVIMKLEQCPSTNDDIMYTYVQVPSMQNSCKIYLRVKSFFFLIFLSYIYRPMLYCVKLCSFLAITKVRDRKKRSGKDQMLRTRVSINTVHCVHWQKRG